MDEHSFFVPASEQTEIILRLNLPFQIPFAPTGGDRFGFVEVPRLGILDSH